MKIRVKRYVKTNQKESKKVVLRIPDIAKVYWTTVI
jgi:hypothetical protein